MNTDKNRNTEEILNSLDGAQRATAPDFFYTRLKARMEKGLDSNYRRNWILRPAFAMIMLVLVVLVNAFVLLKNTDSSNDTVASNTDTESVPSSIASEYSLNDNSAVYEINQEK